MLNKKSLIFFSKNMKIGGMEKALLVLLNNLAKEDYLITLVLEKKEGELLPFLNSSIKIEEYQLSSSNHIFFRKAKNFSKRLIWSFQHKNKYDFSCNYATYSVIGAKLALCTSKKSLLYVHSDYYSMYQGDENKIKAFFHAREIRKFWKVSFVSNQSMQLLTTVYPEISSKFLVLNNLFDVTFFEKQQVEKKEKTVFLFLGRLDESSKKITRLLEAMKLHKKNHRNIQLWIVGEGPDEEHYRKIVKREQLEDYVCFFEKHTNPGIYLQQCDYFILTSDYEGFPVTFFEAIYFQKPIVTTIEVSDQFLDIKDYACIVEKNPKSIEQGMIDIQQRQFVYTYDFEKNHKLRLKQFIEIIEMSRSERR